MNKAIIYLFVLLLLGCSDLETDHITGNYYIDTFEGVKSLSFKWDDIFLEVVRPVISVGSNEQYIVATQGYSSNDANFYIIPLKHPVSEFPDENKIGPLSQEEYNHLRDSLRIDIRLTKVK